MSEKASPFNSDEIPLWFIPFARHLLRCCGQPGRYEIILEVPSADDQPREISIWHQRLVRSARCENTARQPRKQAKPAP